MTDAYGTGEGGRLRMEAVASAVVAGPRDNVKTDSAWPRHLGDLIYAEMKKRGWSQEQVANHFGVAQSSVARWIDGSVKVSAKRVKDVANWAHIDPAVAFKLNFKIDPSVNDLSSITQRMDQLEESVAHQNEQMQSVRDQVKLLNHALSELLDKVSTARQRNVRSTKP